MTDATQNFARFTVEPVAFSRAVEFLSKRIAVAGRHVDIISHVLVVADEGGTVTLTACDLDMQAAMVLPADVETAGTFTTDCFALSDVLAKVRKNKDSYAVTMRDGEKLELVSGRNRFNLKRTSGEGFPAIVTSEGRFPVAFDLPAAQFIGDLGMLAPCVSTNDNRYYLCGVAMQVRDLGGRDRLAMIATDGGKLGVASRALPDGAGMMADCLLPSKAVTVLRNAAKLLPDCDTVAVEFDAACGGGVLRFTLGALSVTAKAIDGTFPTWEHLFEGQLAPTGDEPPMFPELMPAAPLKDMQTVERAVKAPVAWEVVRDGMMGTVANDDGLLFAAMNMTDKMAQQPVKGFWITYTADSEAALKYLCAIADKNAGREVPRSQVGMQLRGKEVLGLTVGEKTWIDGHYVDVPNWETLHIEKVHIEGHWQYADGAHSIVMPRERAKLAPDVSLHIDGDETVYAMGVNSANTLHLSADQVRAIVGESCFETMALIIAGRAVYILQWLYDQGDSRFLTVRADGRCFKGRESHLAQYLTRDQVDAALRGEGEAVKLPALPAPVATQDESAPLAAHDSLEAVATLSEAESCPVELSEDAGQLPDVAPVEVPAATPVDKTGDISPSVAQALLARIEALEALVASQPAAPVSIVEAIPEPANDDSHPRRVRTEGERRAIIRAWRMRQAMRAQADLDMRALQKVSADNRFILETLHKSEERVAELERKVIEAKALVDAAEAENVASVTRMSRQAKEMVDAVRADMATMERLARAAEVRADNAEGRAMRMVRAASGYRTRMRRAGEDLRGARAEARALGRRLDEARRTISEAAPIVPPAGNTIAAAFASALS